jgi:hypothetical protein
MYTSFSDLKVNDNVYVISSDFTPTICKVTNVIQGSDKIDTIVTDTMRLKVDCDNSAEYNETYNVYVFADKNYFMEHLLSKIKTLNEMCLKVIA